MKRNKLLLLSLIVILSASACGSGSKAEAQGQQTVPLENSTTVPSNAANSDSPTTHNSGTVADLSMLGETQRVEDGGFSFRPIPEYELNIFGGMVSMMAPGADPEIGPILQLMGWKNESEVTNEDLYNQLKNETFMQVGPSNAIQIAGVPGLSADISGDNNGKPMQGKVAMVMVTPHQQFVLMFGAPQSEWETVAPYFDAVLASLEFFELVTPAPVSSLSSGMYAYTNGNVVRDLVVYNGVVHAATLGGLVTWRLDSVYSMQYTPLNGMGHVSAKSITYCEIPEPRILVGTLSGISIYDPNSGLWESKSLAPADSRVDVSTIDRLYCDQANNRLLIGYNGLGVLDLATGDFQHYTKSEGLLWDSVTDITVNGKDIWIANGYKGIAKISNGLITNYSAADGMPDEKAYALAFTKDGTLWVGAYSGMLTFKSGKWNLYSSESPANLNSINEIKISTDDKIWTATAPLGIGRLCQFNPTTAACDVDFKEMDNQAILALALSEDGLPIYGTSKGVYVFENGMAKPFKTEDQLISNFVDSISQAPDGQLWVGTDAGIQLIDPGNPAGIWETYSQNTDPAMGGKWASSIAFAPDGTAWVAIINGTASRFQNGEWTAFKDISSFNSVTVDLEGRAWFGDDGKGIIVLNSDGSPAMKLTTAEGLPGDNIQALLTDASGCVWIGTDQGLAKYENNKLDIVFGKDSSQLPNKYIRALALDNEGALVIGTFTGIARYKDGQVETLVDFLKDGFAEARLTTLAVDPNGKIWAGTDKGLLSSNDLTNWTMLTTKDGMLTNYISALYVDTYGAIWVGGGGSNFDGGGLLHIVP